MTVVKDHCKSNHINAIHNVSIGIQEQNLCPWIYKTEFVHVNENLGQYLKSISTKALGDT